MNSTTRLVNTLTAVRFRLLEIQQWMKEEREKGAHAPGICLNWIDFHRDLLSWSGTSLWCGAPSIRTRQHLKQKSPSSRDERDSAVPPYLPKPTQRLAGLSAVTGFPVSGYAPPLAFTFDICPLWGVQASSVWMCSVGTVSGLHRVIPTR